MKKICRIECTLPLLTIAVIMMLPVLAWNVNAAEDETQTQYATSDEALGALQQAVKAGDTNALGKLFGPALHEMANPDPVECQRDLAGFARHMAEFSELSKQDNGNMVLLMGNEHWPFPIPLVNKGGKWFFDTLAGKEEVLNRRIGHNELSTIEVCHAYVKAQREYAAKDPDANGVMEYAERIRSAPEKRNGLYWEAKSDEEQSPFGPLVAKAALEGYTGNELSAMKRQHNPFHGYFFKILKKQGANAPGGRYDYVINGHMVAGFALLAYPAQWGNSGVMTLIVNQQGKVYEKNLGEKTTELAGKIEEYDPDGTWKPAE
jgi:hypothetical protein